MEALEVGITPGWRAIHEPALIGDCCDICRLLFRGAYRFTVPYQIIVNVGPPTLALLAYYIVNYTVKYA